jgi:hypothetical protein
MARLNTDQLRRRDQFESVIRIAEPFLNVVLAVGDRLSRAVEPEDKDYSPPRAPNLPPPAGPEGAGTAARGIAPGPNEDAG